jgi:bifunctional DNase/RNase
MKVEGLLFDPRSGMYILLLKDIQGNETLPIWIGKPEADAIALSLGKVVTPRPMTHDLIRNIVNGLSVRVMRIVITEIIDNTYYALVYIEQNGTEVAIDSRPSDAIALALRVSVPIYVDERVIEHKNTDGLEEWLKNLKPEDFGKVM